MLDFVIPVGFIFAALVVFQIGSTPTITVGAKDENDCQHVLVTRYWEHSTLVDAVVCDGEEFIMNGENLLETE